MIRYGLFAVVLGVLAGCGADGEPVQPAMNVGIGVSSGGGGHTGGFLGMHQGPFSVYLGF